MSINRNLDLCLSPEEAAELTAVSKDTSSPEAAKKANVLLKMSAEAKEDGAPLSVEERITETVASMNVSRVYIRDCVDLYKIAGINGLKRVNLEVKPDIVNRVEDRVPRMQLEADHIPGVMAEDHLLGMICQKVSELSGIGHDAAAKVCDIIKMLGCDIVPVNPERIKHTLCKESKHAEIAGIWIGYHMGVFAIATKNVSLPEEGKPFILRHVFKGTVPCADSMDAISKVFEEPGHIPSTGNASRCFSQFFEGLQKAYPVEMGWHVHCFVLDERAATDPVSGEPLIGGLPDISGYTYEKTVHRGDFGSPIRAAFHLAGHRDGTSMCGWKVRDRVISLIRNGSQSMEPIMYIGAKADIPDPDASRIEMSASIHFPGIGAVVVRTASRPLPSCEDLGADTMESFQEAASSLDFAVTDLSKELAGHAFQGAVNAAQMHAAGKSQASLVPLWIEAEAGRRQVWATPSIAAPFGQKAMMYTDNFSAMLYDNVKDQSFRLSCDKMNRALHRRDFEKICPTTVQDKAARDGMEILGCLDSECAEGLEAYQVKIEDGKVVSHKIPENAVNPGLVSKAAPTYDTERLEAKLRQMNKNRSEDEQLTLEQVMKELGSMEKDPQKTVYVMFDGVLVKMQRGKRRKKGSKTKAKHRKGGSPKGKRRGRGSGSQGQPPAVKEKEKKRIETHNVYILYQDKAYVLMGTTMDEACRNALGFLLKTGLLEGNELVFFSDGAKTIKSTIERYFSFRKYLVFLDWFHVEQKIYQMFTQFLKGGKARLEENKELRSRFFTLLWEGRIDDCKAFIRNIDKNAVKSPEGADNIISYLDSKAEHIPCFVARKLAGLINSSNRVEQANNELESKRQKKNGMAWCPTGSRSLGAITMIYMNKIQAVWYSKHKVAFEMFETKVPETYLPNVA